MLTAVHCHGSSLQFCGANKRHVPPTIRLLCSRMNQNAFAYLSFNSKSQGNHSVITYMINRYIHLTPLFQFSKILNISYIGIFLCYCSLQSNDPNHFLFSSKGILCSSLNEGRLNFRHVLTTQSNVLHGRTIS